MLYTQTSLSLVYNLERVSKSLHCYCATYQFVIVAWLRLEPNSYSTKLYSLHRRCSFGPVAVALGQLSESFVLSPLYCSLELVAAKCRCRCVLDVQLKLWLLCCLTSTEAGWPIRDGDRVGKGTGWLARPRKPPEKDRRDRRPPPEQWKC